MRCSNGSPTARLGALMTFPRSVAELLAATGVRSDTSKSLAVPRGGLRLQRLPAFLVTHPAVFQPYSAGVVLQASFINCMRLARTAALSFKTPRKTLTRPVFLF